MKQNNVNYEQQQLHSLLPLGEGGRRPDEGLKETVRCNSDEMLKQVQHDGKGLAKDAQSQCPPLEGGPEFSIPRRGSERSELLTPHQGGPACTNTQETAKGGQQSLHSFAPWGEGQDEGSYKFDTADMTPHQGRPACTNTLETAKEVRSTSSLAVLSRKGLGMFYRQCENFLIALFL